MSITRIMTWVLVLVMLFSVSGAMAENIYNEDGSYVQVNVGEDGVVQSKYYYDAEGNNYLDEYFNPDGTLSSYTKFFTDDEGRYVNENFDAEGGLLGGEARYFDEVKKLNITELFDSNRVLVEYAETAYKPEGGGSTTQVFSPDGTLLRYSQNSWVDGGTSSEKIYNAKDQLIQEYSWGPDGEYRHATYYENGNLKSEDGSTGTDGWFVKEYNEAGVLISENVGDANNQWIQREYDDAGNLLSEQTSTHTVQNEYRDGKLYQTVTVTRNETGELTTTTRQDAAGNIISETQTTYDESGMQLTTMTKDGSGKIISEDWLEPDTGNWAGWELDHNGVKIAYSYEGDIKIEERTAPDGTVTTIRNKMDMTSPGQPFVSFETYVNGKLVSTSLYGERDPETLLPSSMETRDMDGNVIETTLWEEQPDGGTIRTTKNAQGTVIEERRYNEDDNYIGGFIMTANGMEKYSYNDYNDKVVEVYDKAGALVEVLVINRDGVVVSKEVKKVAVLPPQPVYTWFPNNTVSTMGLSFREVKPELTKKWYHFTPIDLSRDGEQVIPLVASNAFIVGRVYVNVKGDEVTVTYMARGQGSAGTFRVHSEFLTFFPDLASVTEVEPEKLGEGFKFGEPISIEKDLNGDTNVLLFVRNVATYRDYYTGDMRHGRYWPNLKQHKDYREALQGMMD